MRNKPLTIQASDVTTTQDSESAIRRIAILLHSLPEHTHESLLERLSDAIRDRILSMLATLDDVDPMEQFRVLNQLREDFGDEADGFGDVESEIQDEISLGASRYRKVNRKSYDPLRAYQFEPTAESNDGISNQNDGQADDSPLAFLAGYANNQLAKLLLDEHPQTISVVLASISPQQAAGVLSELPGSLQTETLSRIGRLSEVAKETLDEISQQLRLRLGVDAETPFAIGRQTLQAIMDALPSDALASNSLRTNTLPLGEEASSTVRAARMAPDHSLASQNPVLSVYRGTADSETATRRHPASGYGAESFQERSSQYRSPASDADDYDDPARTSDTRANNSGNEIDSMPIERIDAMLLHLPVSHLCKSLGLVSTRHAFLTLCGLPNEAAERALAQLPRRQAKKVRQGMRHLGDLRLNEIDEAKRAVALVARRSQGQVLPEQASQQRAPRDADKTAASHSFQRAA
ncbi:FliG C-terminal domain-containing protein [Stieleria varia]|uniref:Flagellar motor switch protein FliG n=1 Tax=Stieleria varia TaxID=2528005 RepID=A0A5C6ARG0_9BACT|nr:FliG C-terminal domain-containing protein [Stieleria varia]TWU02623.1 Flagellar motor switch protein FliG [Stieleria varia]